ncbi:hypothetical protein NQ036_03735 [Brevibacterium sp. 91QC2O2]|uniref:hypothetical protein n=1 Tax=Brevibacterium sp. 91QC2O2 TaxID=2968458 RepID=UPI00211CBD14|nr:hypothetical protein [Brevibacterium sp. 91QC2O2]MCQ9367358.1 hypothetical protein [Brevibacterium sp. 91QC2O2]
MTTIILGDGKTIDESSGVYKPLRQVVNLAQAYYERPDRSPASLYLHCRLRTAWAHYALADTSKAQIVYGRDSTDQTRIDVIWMVEWRDEIKLAEVIEPTLNLPRAVDVYPWMNRPTT